MEDAATADGNVRVRAGDLLFVSGRVGSRVDGTPEPDFARQVQLAFDNLAAVLAAVLAAAGWTSDDVVDATSFHTDPGAQLETVMTVRPQEQVHIARVRVCPT